MPVASGNLPRLGFTQFHISHVGPPGAAPDLQQSKKDGQDQDVRTTSLVFVGIIEHTRHSQETLVLERTRPGDLKKNFADGWVPTPRKHPPSVFAFPVSTALSGQSLHGRW